MRYLSLLALFFLLLFSSCREDFEFETSSGGLEFSKNTVYLDTVFTNIGSSTYRLKVYNRSDKDISIPKIKLQRGTTSKYRIMVDGMTGDVGAQGKIFSNVELLAKDSLFIFIEVTADVASANPSDFLYTDKIEFDNSTGIPQTVDLVTLIQDAYFIYPQRTGVPGEYLYEAINLGLDDDNETVITAGSNLSPSDPINGNELHWTNDKPYVIYGFAFVPGTETLIVDPGARVHFHANSGLIIGKDAKIKINGTAPPDNDPENLVNEVIFEGDRLEPGFAETPGQWAAIINYSTSTENEINHLTLKNATVGILCGNLATTTNTTDIPKLTIKNSQFYNCANVGILARKSTITGENVVGNYCGQATLACTFGGTYNFTHCTFNNDWNSSQQVAVLLSDYFETSDTIFVSNLIEANFNNCIIYGSNQIEMILDKKNTDINDFNYKFNHCIIKFNPGSNFVNDPLYQFATDATHYLNCYIAINSTLYNPKYVNPNRNKMWLSEDISLNVNPVFSNFNDIVGNSRILSPDLGAYQFVP